MKNKKRTILTVLVLAIALTLFSAVAVQAQDPTCTGPDCPPTAPEVPPVSPPVSDSDVWKAISFMTVLIMALVGKTKQLWASKPGAKTFDWLAALALSMATAYFFHLNGLASFGMKANTHIAELFSIGLTGYAMSFGSNFLNDAFKKAGLSNGSSSTG
jgi:hypothetical protein